MSSLETNILNAKKLLDWYDQNSRVLPWRISPIDRRSGIVPIPYRVWLSEIMLQQTTIASVKDYYVRFEKKWPTLDDLANAPLDDVLKMWAGLGYYSRARNLHKCAQQIQANHEGIFPDKAHELQKLAGIGPYTSAAIAAICFDENIPVIDGNVERVMARLLALETPQPKAKSQIKLALQTALISNRVKRNGDFAQAMMDLGATVCTPRQPRCDVCPLRKECRAFVLENPQKFPVKLPKKSRPAKFGNAYIMRDKSGAIFLQKRAEKGLLAQMSEVPNTEWSEKTHPPSFPIVGDWKSRGMVTHIFTHLKLEMEVFELADGVKHSRLRDLGMNGWWVSPENLKDEALPTLFKKVLAKTCTK